MPIAQLIKSATTKTAELRERLRAEWEQPQSASGGVARQPVLIEDKNPEGGIGVRPSIHLYVIWDEWEPLSQQERSEVIMDAYEATHELSDVVRVTVAMGLTEKERRKMGLEYHLS